MKYYQHLVTGEVRCAQHAGLEREWWQISPKVVDLIDRFGEPYLCEACVVKP